VKAFLVGAMALLVAPVVGAQVGHEPARSPYVDVEHGQEITPIFGYLRARSDPAGVAPRSAPMAGLRYEIGLTGPLAFSTDVVRSFSQRTLINPLRPSASRVLGTQSSPVYAVDAALALNLTGRKSWHHVVPQVRAGLGILSSRAAEDSSGFSFGTPFAFSLGGGLKFVPDGGRVQLRADLTDRIFKLRYPDSYYRLASDNTAVLPTTTANSFYTHHLAMTVGLSYRFGR
jgi:hypothetical protein